MAFCCIPYEKKNHAHFVTPSKCICLHFKFLNCEEFYYANASKNLLERVDVDVLKPWKIINQSWGSTIFFIAVVGAIASGYVYIGFVTVFYPFFVQLQKEEKKNSNKLRRWRVAYCKVFMKTHTHTHFISTSTKCERWKIEK